MDHAAGAEKHVEALGHVQSTYLTHLRDIHITQQTGERLRSLSGMGFDANIHKQAVRMMRSVCGMCVCV